MIDPRVWAKIVDEMLPKCFITWGWSEAKLDTITFVWKNYIHTITISPDEEISNILICNEFISFLLYLDNLGISLASPNPEDNIVSFDSSERTLRKRQRFLDRFNSIVANYLPKANLVPVYKKKEVCMSGRLSKVLKGKEGIPCYEYYYTDYTRAIKLILGALKVEDSIYMTYALVNDSERQASKKKARQIINGRFEAIKKPRCKSEIRRFGIYPYISALKLARMDTVEREVYNMFHIKKKNFRYPYIFKIPTDLVEKYDFFIDPLEEYLTKYTQVISPSLKQTLFKRGYNLYSKYELQTENIYPKEKS